MRNTLFSSVGIYTEYFLGMLVSIIVARHLGPAHFGTYSLVVWMVGIGVTATNSGSATAVTKFVAELRGAGREDLVVPLLKHLRRLQLYFLVAVAAIGACVLTFGGERLAPGLNHLGLFGLLVVAVSLRAPYMFNVNVAKGFENFRATATIAAIATPLNLTMVIIAWWIDAPVEGFLTIYAISSAVFYLISRQQIARMMPAVTKQEALPPDLLRRLHRHIRIVAVMVTVGFLMASEMEVAFLTFYGNVAAAGQFKVAYQLAGGASLLVPGVFAAVLLPMMANALSQGKEVAVRRFSASTAYLAILAIPLIGFGIVFASPTIHLLYGSAYVAAAPVFAICLLGGGLGAIAQAASSLLISADHQHSMLYVYLLCGILKFSLDVVLISNYGLTGAMVAYIIVSVVWFATNMALGLRVSGARMPWERLARIALAGVLAALLVVPLRGVSPALLALALGGPLLCVAYALLTVCLGCWSRADLDYLHGLHQQLARGRPRAIGSLLMWASARARKAEA
ncbi:MAG: polysaccharide biosynthesis C-terminal domain-containing protein [Dokdonella sp.]